MHSPETEQQLAEVIRVAKGSLCIQGGGTRGCAVAGEVLSTSGLRGIALYEPGALTMVAGAGTPLAEIETTLAAEGQMLPFEPYELAGLTGAAGASTIGGLFASNASGPRRIQVGAARDFLLGVRFVDGAGRIVKNGGRVMKNVTGYDLVKLMAGSHGTLGVLSEVAFKVLPRPETSRTLVLRGLGLVQAGEAMRAALASPYDVSGAAHVPGEGYGATYIRVEGFADSTTYRASRLAELLSRWAGGVEILDDAPIWSDLRDGACVAGEGDIWRISLRPSDGPAAAAELDALSLSLDWGGGLIWARMAPGSDLRVKLAAFRGHARLIRGEGQPRFQPEPAPIARLSAGLRAQFDPRGILNPGLMA